MKRTLMSRISIFLIDLIVPYIITLFTSVILTRYYLIDIEPKEIFPIISSIIYILIFCTISYFKSKTLGSFIFKSTYISKLNSKLKKPFFGLLFSNAIIFYFNKGDMFTMLFFLSFIIPINSNESLVDKAFNSIFIKDSELKE